MSISPGFSSPNPLLRDIEERSYFLIQLLNECASAVAADNVENANVILEHISLLASPNGNPLQRIAAYFSAALADRMLKGWPGLYKALNATNISSVSESLLVQKLFFELCPFLKVAYVVTNQAIVEAMEREKVVHIIDLNPSEPAQWIDLIHSLGARPEGPPYLRITGIHEQNEVLDKMATILKEEAENLDIPFQFHHIVCKLEDLDIESLSVKTGEALAVSSVLQLHSLLATDDVMQTRNSPLASRIPNASQMQKFLHMNINHPTLGEWLGKSIPVYNPSPESTLSPLSLAASPKMGNFLSDLWTLSPKLVVITEQESDNNEFTLTERVKAALYFYAELFDCLEYTLSRASSDRQKVEKMLFGEEIMNIVSCEGTERKERHEKLEKWILRLESAGFRKVPLSYHNMIQANRLLCSSGFIGYKIQEEKGCLFINWQSKPLFSVSAWRYRRCD